MLDLSCLKKRYFVVRFQGRRLDLEPPKIKTINKIISIAKAGNNGDVEAVGDLSALIAKLLGKNKQQFKVTTEMVEEMLDWDAMMQLIMQFFAWLNAEKNDPN